MDAAAQSETDLTQRSPSWASSAACVSRPKNPEEREALRVDGVTSRRSPRTPSGATGGAVRQPLHIPESLSDPVPPEKVDGEHSPLEARSDACKISFPSVGLSDMSDFRGYVKGVARHATQEGASKDPYVQALLKHRIELQLPHLIPGELDKTLEQQLSTQREALAIMSSAVSRSDHERTPRGHEACACLPQGRSDHSRCCTSGDSLPEHRPRSATQAASAAESTFRGLGWLGFAQCCISESDRSHKASFGEKFGTELEIGRREYVDYPQPSYAQPAEIMSTDDEYSAWPSTPMCRSEG